MSEVARYERELNHTTSMEGLRYLLEKGAPFELITRNPDWAWDWYQASKCPDLDWSFVLKNNRRSWSWKHLSIHPKTTWELVQAHPEFPWDWTWLSLNPNITPEIVRANPGAPWNSYHVGLKISNEIIATGVKLSE